MCAISYLVRAIGIWGPKNKQLAFTHHKPLWIPKWIGGDLQEIITNLQCRLFALVFLVLTPKSKSPTFPEIHILPQIRCARRARRPNTFIVFTKLCPVRGCHLFSSKSVLSIAACISYNCRKQPHQEKRSAHSCLPLEYNYCETLSPFHLYPFLVISELRKSHFMLTFGEFHPISLRLSHWHKSAILPTWPRHVLVYFPHNVQIICAMLRHIRAGLRLRGVVKQRRGLT